MFVTNHRQDNSTHALEDLSPVGFGVSFNTSCAIPHERHQPPRRHSGVISVGVRSLILVDFLSPTKRECVHQIVMNYRYLSSDLGPSIVSDHCCLRTTQRFIKEMTYLHSRTTKVEYDITSSLHTCLLQFLRTTSMSITIISARSEPLRGHRH